jgi:HrpA-like RNA helicase
LKETCLLAKLTSPFNISITDFLAKAPESPSFMLLRNSINHLKSVGCLDVWEDLTELGIISTYFPIESKLVKMILYAAFLKCLNPVLTIACSIVLKPCNTSSKLYDLSIVNHAFSFKFHLIWLEKRISNRWR